MVAAAPRPVPGRSILTGRFVVVTASALLYFIAIGALAPTLPRYVEEDLGGSGTQAGIAVGVFALSAAVLRPTIGRIGDRYGRRVLVVGGAAIAGVAILGYSLPGGLPVLVLMRLLTGVGEAGVFVGAATTAQDLAPPDQRGRAASYFSVAIYGGLAIGPVLGEALRTQLSFDAVWVVTATSCLLAALLATRMPARVEVDDEDDGLPATPAEQMRGLRAYLHPAARRPGAILFLATAATAGFFTFTPSYSDELGMGTSGGVLALYAGAVLLVRILASGLPDRLGPRRAPTYALLVQVVGLGAVWVTGSVAGLYAGALVYALGVSMLYPALFPTVIAKAPQAERSQAVASFSLCFDVSQALGAPLLGVLADLAGPRAVFLGAAVLCALGYLVHRSHGDDAVPVAAVEEPVPPPLAGQ